MVGHFVIALLLTLLPVTRTIAHSIRSTHCPPSSLHNQLDGHCYGFHNKNVTWNAAETACLKQAPYNTSGHLVTIDNYQEAMFLSAFPVPLLRNRHTWVNYQDIGGNGRWSRRDCTNQTYVPQESMRNFVPNGRRGLCGVIDILSNTWTALNCNETNMALCEFEPGRQRSILTDQDVSCLHTSAPVSTAFTRFIDRIRSKSFSTSRGHSLSRPGFLLTQKSYNLFTRSKCVSPTGNCDIIDENNIVKSKRDVDTVRQNTAVSRNKISSEKSQTIRTTSETMLNSSSLKTSNNLEGTEMSPSAATEININENKTTFSSPPTPYTVHVVIGILGIIVFVILICGLFINDLKSMTLHIVRGEEGRASRESQALNYPHLTVNVNYQNEQSSTQTLSQSRERLSFQN